MSDPVVERVSVITADMLRALADALADPVVLEHLVGERVQQRIDAGELVGRDRLQVGAAIELAPIGLEQAARAVVTAAGKRKLPEKLGEAIAELASVFAAGAGQSQSQPSAVSRSSATDAAPAGDDSAGAGEPIQELRCAVCDAKITEEEALLSHSRWREPLCAEHHASGGTKGAAKKEEEPDVVAG